jgi:cysteine desulfurase family protein
VCGADERPEVYLDHAATAGARPEEVSRAVLQALLRPGNPGRGAHRASLEAARTVLDARLELAGLLGVSDPARVALTKNATEALNLVLRGFLRRGDRVLCSAWEHNATMRPLRYLEQRLELDVRVVPPAGEEPLDLERLEGLLNDGGARMVCALDASNVSGAILPLREVGALCRAHGAFLLVDAAQGAGLLTHDVERDGVDALCVTGHKHLLGPQGTGALYLREPERVEPLLRGGTGSRSEEETHPPFPPDRFEAGTANVPGLAGLAAGVRHVRRQGPAAIRARLRDRTAELLDALRSVPGLRVHGPADAGRRVGIVSFTLAGISTSDTARALAARNIYCRAGLHCAPRAHRTMGTLEQGTVRFSLSGATTCGELRRAVDAVREVAAGR